jgi:pimeloyl-ACP methyl ester carboxylesterase
MLALLDHLHISTINGIGISGGGNVLLHMAAMRRSRIGSMVLVSATPYFPVQAGLIMRQYADSLPDEQRVVLRQSHPGGDPQIDALLSSTRAFADSYDDMDFTPPLLSTMQARTLIVQGDRDPLYPLELSVEMAKAIPQSGLWIIPDSGHGPILGEKWDQFLATAFAFVSR